MTRAAQMLLNRQRRDADDAHFHLSALGSTSPSPCPGTDLAARFAGWLDVADWARDRGPLRVAISCRAKLLPTFGRAMEMKVGVMPQKKADAEADKGKGGVFTVSAVGPAPQHQHRQESGEHG